MPRWLGLTSHATSSTASGTTPSRQDRKIKLLFPDRPLAVSPFEKPRWRRKSDRSSSVRATIRARAARMPATKVEADESAKLASAGAASSAKREAAYFE